MKGCDIWSILLFTIYSSSYIWYLQTIMAEWSKIIDTVFNLMLILGFSLSVYVAIFLQVVCAFL